MSSTIVTDYIKPLVLQTGIVVGIVLAFCCLCAAPLTFLSRNSVMYVISPKNCSATLYANASKYLVGDWYLVSAWGNCPSKAIPWINDVGSQRLMRGHQGDYTNCIDFSYNQKLWEIIDSNNRKSGYNSTLSKDAMKWRDADRCIICSEVVMFLLYIHAMFLCGQYRRFCRTYVRVSFIFLNLLLGGLFWGMALLYAHKSAQVDPKSWSTSFFATCEVSVSESTAFYDGSFVVIACALSILFIILVSIVKVTCFSKPISRHNSFEAGGDKDENEMEPFMYGVN